MYQPDDLLPKNRNYILLLGCFTFFFTIFLGYWSITLLLKEQPTQPTISIREETTIPMADISRYNQDSDRDVIPNFIEEEAILNTYISEIDYCENSNPLCADTPFKNDFYFTIILDSSTSMNIPALKDSSKLENVKDEIKRLLDESIREEFVKIQLTGFGNKGNLSFIADNESCVTNINFKNFNQLLVSPELNSLVLDRYVPNGKSPLGYTLEQAEKQFPDKNGNNYVIVITDGTDDCGSDINYTISQILSRGIVKKVNIISYFAPQDENQKLREAAEGNGGSFTSSTQIFDTIKNWKTELIYSKWCKLNDLNKVFQCLDRNYSKAFTLLDNQIKEDTATNELNKIKEVKSSVDLFIQNYRKSRNDLLRKEFNQEYTNYFKTN